MRLPRIRFMRNGGHLAGGAVCSEPPPSSPPNPPHFTPALGRRRDSAAAWANSGNDVRIVPPVHRMGETLGRGQRAVVASKE